MNDNKDRNIEALRGFQRIIRPLAEHDEYQRGLYNGIEMALAVLRQGSFAPVLRPRLNEQDVVEEALDILRGGAES